MRSRVAVAGVVAGLAGGLLGAAVMSAGHALAMRIAGDQLATPSTDPKEPDSTLLVAERVSELTRQRPLDDSEHSIASNAVHYAFGGTVGLVYGALAPVVPIIAAGTGALYGLAVYGVAHGAVVPALGLARSPLRSPLKKEALELVLHVAYGLTVGLVYRAAVRTSR